MKIIEINHQELPVHYNAEFAVVFYTKKGDKLLENEIVDVLYAALARHPHGFKIVDRRCDHVGI